MTYRARASSSTTRALGYASVLLVACGSGTSGGNKGEAQGGTGGGSATGGSGGGSATGGSGGGSAAGGSGGSGLAAGSGGSGVAAGSGGTGVAGAGAGMTGSGGSSAATGGNAGTSDGGGRAGSAANAGGAETGSGGQAAGAGHSGQGGVSGGGNTGGGGAGGRAVGGGGAGGAVGGAGQSAGAAGAAGSPSSCVGGKAWPTADPTKAGPFQVTADKNVGPLAGYTPDPIYGDVQQRFNVYRPSNLKDSGYCHPILVWANGHGDNPEQHPPECVVDSATNRWCGTYPVLINQLASHGFVVVASLSTTTSKGDPLPTIVGLNWLLEQSEDSTSPYYHRLDTPRIGALGHSEGGLSTCKAAADPRITTIATISGSATPTGLKGPALFICGGQDTVVSCDSVATTFDGVTDHPAMLMNNKSADHGSWEYQNGAQGPDIFAMTAWFRVHLMDDTANRKYFYGASCTLCSDNRLTVERNSLMMQ